MQTFGIVENGQVRDMTPEEIERLASRDENPDAFQSDGEATL